MDDPQDMPISRETSPPFHTRDRSPVVVAVLVSAAVVLSSPFVGDLQMSLRRALGGNFGHVINAFIAGAVVVASLVALARVRERRRLRLGVVAAAILLGVVYIRANALPSVERFHFVEYGLITFLFYRASRPQKGRDPSPSDLSVIAVPILAALVVGTADEWLQWFVPRRYGEVRDIFLNGAAIGCGLLFSVGVAPPARFSWRLRSRALRRTSTAAAIATLALGGFVYVVHLGYAIDDSEIGRFRSRHSASELASVSAERAARWSRTPPASPPTLSREDQYLTEGLWHVQKRNELWGAGAIDEAWNENRILEKYFGPVLRLGHAWPDEQRADAERRRSSASLGSYTSDAERVPIVTWPRSAFVAVVLLAAAVLLATNFTSGRW